jgi:hypothetical protein
VLFQSVAEGEAELKEYECVQVGHYKDVGKIIAEWQKKGWRLHTYACAQYSGMDINHYLLFERESRDGIQF